MVDARLADGSRVNAIIPPLAVDGPLLSIRRFGTDKLMPRTWSRSKSMTPGHARAAARARSRRGSTSSSPGGTGSGKTTLLNGLSAFISPKERVVTIEDAAELQLKQPHVARLETRPPNIEGGGAVRQRELLINALRMRPDRIIVGECRGEEALDMLQAMNTGHDGSMTTVHANSPRDVITRLEVMVTMANSNLILVSIRHADLLGHRLIVQTARLERRHPQAACRSPRSAAMEGDMVMLQDLFVFEKTRPLARRPRAAAALRRPASGRAFTSGCWRPASRFPASCLRPWWRFSRCAADGWPGALMSNAPAASEGTACRTNSRSGCRAAMRSASPRARIEDGPAG